MSIKVVLYDAETHCEIRTLEDGFPSVSAANEYRQYLPMDKTTFTKMEQSETPIRQWFYDTPDYGSGQQEIQEPAESNNKPGVFWEGWIICILLGAAIIFYALKLM